MESAPAPHPDVAPAAELTGRALSVGLAVGLLLSLGNVYIGLKTGMWDSGSITASVLGFGLLSAWARLDRRAASPLETNLAQSAAVAVGAAPAAAGLLGAVPALAMLGHEVPGWLAAAWGLALGALGVLVAAALRRRLLEEERLPFPSGLAAARVIRAAHGAAGSGARPLVGTGLVAAAVTVARDVAGLLPGFTAWPGSLAGAPAAAYGLGLAWSPAMAGVGLVVGVGTGLGVLAGCLLAWGAIGPALVRSGVVAGASFETLAPWLAWPGVGLLLGSAAVSLGSMARAFVGAARDLLALRGVGRLGGALALLLSLAVAGLGAAGFGMGPLQSLLALVLAVPLCAVCARAAGLTDISPVVEVGQVALATTALSTGAAGPAAIGAGSVTASAAAQTGVSLWSFRSGLELGATPRSQALAMLLGAAAGSAVAVPAYLLLVRAHGLGTEALPVPGAVPWRALAEALSSGLSAVPPGAAAAGLAGIAVGLVLEILQRTRLARVLPPPGALGMGFLVPFHYGAAIALGAVGGALWRWRRPAQAEASTSLVAAGAIAGESLAGVAVAAVLAAGLLGR
jgi:uncharacterized oligopeptide transporter (OPT) family protein